ncbi:hypothetical protein [Chitinophaga sp.]|uniref:hypothetical protein n=1 Tax=Chitinophaga sp. TaxID=1869181 RepID=UPI0031D8ACAB
MTAKEALTKIKTLLTTAFNDEGAGQKFESGKLSDGTMIEYSKLEAGGDISVVGADGTKTPAPVGNYELEDGRIVVVSEAGKIAEVKDAAKAAEPAADQQQQQAQTQQMAEGDPATPAAGGGAVDWTQAIKDMKASIAWQAERIASLQNAMQTFKDASSKTFTAFMEFLEADQATAITNPKQTVFSDAKTKKDAAKTNFMKAYGAFQDKLKEKTATA